MGVINFIIIINIFPLLARFVRDLYGFHPLKKGITQ